MLSLVKKTDKGAMIRNDVAAWLYDVFSADYSTLGSLDRWTQRRVTDENMAKISLVLESDDPIEHCYQNLVREIDTEAETGIYLAHRRAASAKLREIARDPGLSGKLHEQMDAIAPVLFADELAHSHQDMDIVWVTIQARYDRANIDATVSTMLMQHLSEDHDSVLDMTDAMRSLLYSFHEDLVRRRAGLPLVLNERATRELLTMIAELAERAGDYSHRVDMICERAGTG